MQREAQGWLSCPCSLVTDFPQGVRECREPELGLEELLRHRCQLLQQHEEYQVRRGLGCHNVHRASVSYPFAHVFLLTSAQQVLAAPAQAVGLPEDEELGVFEGIN